MKKINKKAFTIVELLAIIAVLAVVLVIAVPTVSNTIKDSKKSSLISTVRIIASAAENQYLEDETYGNLNTVECADIVKLKKSDYEKCFIEFEDKKAKITIKGKGKFSGLNVCEGTKTTAEVSEANCDVKYGRASTYVEKLEAFTTNNGLFVDDTEDKNIRYRGSNPNNYVYFNCKDKDTNNIKYGSDNYDYEGSCEVWRIIGVFEVDNGNGNIEKRVKMIRDIFPIKMSWDSTVKEINTGNGINQWGPSTYEDGGVYEGADLMQLLNGYYIGNGNSCSYCNLYYQGKCENDCTSSITPLSNTSLSMIGDVLWNLGAVTFSETIPLSTMYEGERSTQIGKICLSTTVETDGKYYCTDTVKRSTAWVGKVGLPYPSDWGYASLNSSCKNDIIGTDSTCENSNWMNPSAEAYWTISPIAHNKRSTFVYGIKFDNFGNVSAMHYQFHARPSVYLKTAVKITEGNGTIEMPYKLDL